MFDVRRIRQGGVGAADGRSCRLGPGIQIKLLAEVAYSGAVNGGPPGNGIRF